MLPLMLLGAVFAGPSYGGPVIQLHNNAQIDAARRQGAIIYIQPPCPQPRAVTVPRIGNSYYSGGVTMGNDSAPQYYVPPVTIENPYVPYSIPYSEVKRWFKKR